MIGMGKTKYANMLKDKDIARWKHNTKAGSEITGDVYFRRLGAFCNEMEKTPQQLVKMKDMALSNLIDDYIILCEKRGNAGSYINNTIKAVKSWLVFNGINLPRKIKIRDANISASIKNERIPTQEELKKIFNAGDSRERTACGIVAFTGVRIGVLGNYTGTDGLKIEDIPDLDVDGDEITFKKIPAQVNVRRELSKSNKAYITFLGQEGCSYLENYLIERIRSGEIIKPESAIITASKFAYRQKQHITANNVGDLMRNAIRNAGFTWRPYVLRAYFDSRLLMAQDERLIIRDYRSFFMGHTGDIESKYTTDKKLSGDQIESMRSAYLKSTKFIETERKGMTEDEMEVKFRSELLIMAGFTEEEIAKNKLLDMNADEITKIAREKLFNIQKVDINAQIQQDKEELSKTHKQKVIPIEQVEEYINNGFIVKMALGSDKAIVEFS